MAVFVLDWEDRSRDVFIGETFDEAFEGSKLGTGIRLMKLVRYQEAYLAQGGGYVIFDAVSKRYKFVANPPEGFEIGDLMPEAWGIAPLSVCLKG